jgi:hypothetical protein
MVQSLLLLDLSLKNNSSISWNVIRKGWYQPTSQISPLHQFCHQYLFHDVTFKCQFSHSTYCLALFWQLCTYNIHFITSQLSKPFYILVLLYSCILPMHNPFWVHCTSEIPKCVNLFKPLTRSVRSKQTVKFKELCVNNMHQNMLCNLQSDVWSLQNNSMWFCIPEQNYCRFQSACTHTHAHTHTHTR